MSGGDAHAVMSGVTHQIWLTNDAEQPQPPGGFNAIHVFATLSYLVITVVALLGLWRYEHNLHGRFWVGDLPVVTLLMLLTVLLNVFGITVAVTVVRRTRGDVRRARAAVLVRCACVLLVALGIVTALLGNLTVRAGSDIARSLAEDCGAAGATQEIERVYQQLEALHADCQGSPENRGKLVDECPGFEAAFPAPAPYPRYLKVLEKESGCTGFCHQAAGRLFFSGRDPHARPKSRESCASHVSGIVYLSARNIGVPCTFLGVIYAVMGVLFLKFGKPEQTRAHA